MYSTTTGACHGQFGFQWRDMRDECLKEGVILFLLRAKASRNSSGCRGKASGTDVGGGNGGANLVVIIRLGISFIYYTKWRSFGRISGCLVFDLFFFASRNSSGCRGRASDTDVGGDGGGFVGGNGGVNFVVIIRFGINLKYEL